MIRTKDRAALKVQTSRRNRTRVEPVADPASEPLDGVVNLSAADVAALFEGTPMQRAIRIAALLPVQFADIFGRSGASQRGEGPPQYRQGRKLRTVGETLTDPIVHEALAADPLWVLEQAAKAEADPAKNITLEEAQIRAACQARIDRLNASAKTRRNGS